jgi:hypothetical protein
VEERGRDEASPFGPAGKFAGTGDNQMLGDFFLVINSEGSGAMGPIKEVAVMGYDAKSKRYTYDAYNSMGEHDTSAGSISGNIWTWQSPEREMGGKKVKGRFIL